jgi:hypothetical protein
MIDVRFKHDELDFKLQRLADAARVDLGKVIRQEGGNVAMSIMMIMPPTGQHAHSKTGEPVRSGLSTAAKQQGENAIKSDLFGGRQRRVGAGFSQKIATSLGIFQRIGSSKLQPPKRARTQTVAIKLGWETSKRIRIYFKYWQPSASIGQMEPFHKRFRNKYGRIGYVSQNTVGRWKVQDQMWIANANADAYLNYVQARVGFSKAGFAAAALACGMRVPAWVRRHAQRAGNTSYNFGANPYIIGTAVNSKIPDVGRYVQQGLEFRVKITQKKIDRILANKAVNLGFAKIDGNGRVEENMPR